MRGKTGLKTTYYRGMLLRHRTKSPEFSAIVFSQCDSSRKETKRLNDLAQYEWSPSKLPSGLTEKIPKQNSVPVSQIDSLQITGDPDAFDPPPHVLLIGRVQRMP